MWIGGSMDKLYDTPLKAIRKKCLDCSCWQHKEVRKCTVIDCPIYPYRLGRRPNKATLDTIKHFREENVEPTGGF
jgi:hypothetical protein